MCACVCQWLACVCGAGAKLPLKAVGGCWGDSSTQQGRQSRADPREEPGRAAAPLPLPAAGLGASRSAERPPPQHPLPAPCQSRTCTSARLPAPPAHLVLVAALQRPDGVEGTHGAVRIVPVPRLLLLACMRAVHGCMPVHELTASGPAHRSASACPRPCPPALPAGYCRPRGQQPLPRAFPGSANATRRLPARTPMCEWRRLPLR